MTHTAGFAAAGVVETILAVTPSLAMGVETDGSAFGAVAVKADVATGMAGLTSRQATPGFPGVTDRPVVEARRY